ncbi:hypothetical protein TWF694_004707 [Orbilia ellipsospora]|uniref:F-box domain-containing protein n=1 Tax=Orbilia ellipsospora TaxID=2528407 RepID=A0AAV9WW37_9PEZI
MSSITDLPVELQENILSYLSFEDQIQAERACKYWSKVLAAPSFRRTRYEPSTDNAGSTGKIEMQEFFGTSSYMSCVAVDGNIRRYKYHSYNSPSDAFAVELPIPKSTIDVTGSSILDDPMILNTTGLIHRQNLFESHLYVNNGSGDFGWEITLKVKPETTIRDVCGWVARAVVGLGAEGLKSTFHQTKGFGQEWIKEEDKHIEDGRIYEILFRSVTVYRGGFWKDKGQFKGDKSSWPWTAHLEIRVEPLDRLSFLRPLYF